MTTTFETSTRIRIEAPDAASALALERRLAHLHPSAVCRGADWSVELQDFDDRLDEIAIATEHWLRELGAGATTMYVDGAVRTIAASRD